MRSRSCPPPQHGAVYLYDRDDHCLALRASTGFDPLPPIACPPTPATLRAFTTGERHRVSSADDLRHVLGDATDA